MCAAVLTGSLALGATPVGTTTAQNGTLPNGQVTMTAEPLGVHSSAADRARDRISSLATLPEDWNTYGGLPIAKRAIQAAHCLLEAGCIQGAPVPQIVPTSDAGIQFEWHLTGRRLEIDIDEEGAMAYFYVDATGEVEGAVR